MLGRPVCRSTPAERAMTMLSTTARTWRETSPPLPQPSRWTLCWRNCRSTSRRGRFVSARICTTSKKYFPHFRIVVKSFQQGGPTQSWRAGVLQSLAPTCLNTPAGMFLVCLVRAWLAGSGVSNWGWIKTLQDTGPPGPSLGTPALEIIHKLYSYVFTKNVKQNMLSYILASSK